MTPLRRLLARHFFLIQLPLLTLMLVMAWWGARALLLDAAQRDGESRLRMAASALDRKMLAVEQAGAQVESYWHQGLLDLRQPVSASKLLMPWLFQQTELRLINLVEESGFSLLLISDRGTWKGREIRALGPTLRNLRWQDVGASGLHEEAPWPRPTGYDARLRPWYQEARLLSAPRWSTPYRLDPPESRLALTWLVPLKRSGDPLQGAAGIDLLPEDFQAFLDDLRPTPLSRLWVMDAKGQLIAATVPAGAKDQSIPSVGRSRLEGSPHRVLESWLPAHPGSQWRMVMAIPEHELLASASRPLALFTAIASLLLLLILVWGLRLSSSLARGIQSLARSAERLGAGLHPEAGHHGIHEFEVVERALDQAHGEVQARIKLQEQLLHAQRLETIGTLAGGIAHDVNNRLGAILGQLHLAKEQLDGDHRAHKPVSRAEEAARNCAKTTASLLAFSRHGQLDLQSLELNHFLKERIDILSRLLGGLVQVTFEPSDGDLPIHGDALQLEQVLMNLAVNARDAMPSGGRLVIRTLTRPGEALISLEDEGEGIPADILPHVIEPFFTTKKVGQGTGLGLSMVMGVIKAHGGGMEILSNPGEGTTVILSLPLQMAPPPLPPSPRREGNEGSHRLEGLNLLVAEDESALLETLEEILSASGASVTAAPDGESAWKAWCAGGFHCVISDQRMPGCTGEELYQRIRSRGSQCPFILASGQDLGLLQSRLGQDPKLRFLHKPFTVSTLRNLVADLATTT